jgi:hypothetical protein
MTGLLETLRNTPALAKANGKASFRKRRTAVTCEAAGWTEVLRRGDLIKTLPDGPWYPIADVVSPGEIRLSRPFAEDDAEAECVVSRVMPAHYDQPTSQFVVAFEVPGAAPPTTAQMLGSESR